MTQKLSPVLYPFQIILWLGLRSVAATIANWATGVFEDELTYPDPGVQSEDIGGEVGYL